MDNAVAIAALGIVATVVGSLIWALKYLLRDFKNAIDRHAAASDKQAKSNNAVAAAVRNDSEISQELLTFMRKLNGRLPKLVDEKKAQAEKES